jgi:hypothetical protein
VGSLGNWPVLVAVGPFALFAAAAGAGQDQGCQDQGQKGRKGEGEKGTKPVRSTPLLPFSPSPYLPFYPATFGGMPSFLHVKHSRLVGRI